MGRVCAKCSGNVTVYQEMQVYAETQVRTTRWMERRGRREEDGEGGWQEDVREPWSKPFPYVYAINSIALVSRRAKFHFENIRKQLSKMVCRFVRYL